MSIIRQWPDGHSFFAVEVIELEQSGWWSGVRAVEGRRL
jgi:hypothetical protein